MKREKSKRNAYAANDRKFRIFSEAAAGDNRRPHAPPGESRAAPGLSSPPSPGSVAPGSIARFGNKSVPIPLPHPRIHKTLQHSGNVRMAAADRATRPPLSVVSVSGSVPCVVRKSILSHLLPYKTTTTETEFPRFQVRKPDLHSVAASPLPPQQRPSPRPRPRIF